MAERMFAPGRTGDGFDYSEAGSGEAVVVILGDREGLTRAHALLAERRHVVALALPADAVTPRQAAQRIGAALAALGIGHFDLLGEGPGAAPALWLALAAEAQIGALVLAAPDGPPDEAFRALRRPALVLAGTEDRSDGGDRWRALLPDCHFMFVYDAGAAIGAERPEALAFIAEEFFERRDLFLVSREDGRVFP
jgi:pimeloyl-ACP methyl ester carboxylesterase